MKASDRVIEIIDGATGRPRYACPGCGRRFAIRWAKPSKTRAGALAQPVSLEAHWWASPGCVRG